MGAQIPREHLGFCICQTRAWSLRLESDHRRRWGLWLICLENNLTVCPGSNFGELLGALSVFLLSDYITTPVGFLRHQGPGPLKLTVFL